MSKIRVLLVGATAAGAFAAASFVPTHADTLVPTPVGNLNVNGGSQIEADGAADNPDPLDGYLTVDSRGICAADNGSAASHTAGTENCNEAIITSQAP